MSPELSRPIVADRVGSDAIEVTVEATPAECAALARRMQIPAVQSLVCRFRLARSPAIDGIEARGRLQARIVQTCIVSLDEFEAPVEETFAVRFVPAGQESDAIDPEAEDEIPYDNGLIDLGEAAAEQLGLALPPYPRRPGVELPDQPADETTNPFAALGDRPSAN